MGNCCKTKDNEEITENKNKNQKGNYSNYIIYILQIQRAFRDFSSAKNMKREYFKKNAIFGKEPNSTWEQTLRCSEFPNTEETLISFYQKIENFYYEIFSPISNQTLQYYNKPFIISEKNIQELSNYNAFSDAFKPLINKLISYKFDLDNCYSEELKINTITLTSILQNDNKGNSNKNCVFEVSQFFKLDFQDKVLVTYISKKLKTLAMTVSDDEEKRVNNIFDRLLLTLFMQSGYNNNSSVYANVLNINNFINEDKYFKDSGNSNNNISNNSNSNLESKLKNKIINENNTKNNIDDNNNLLNTSNKESKPLIYNSNKQLIVNQNLSKLIELNFINESFNNNFFIQKFKQSEQQTQKQIRRNEYPTTVTPFKDTFSDYNREEQLLDDEADINSDELNDSVIDKDKKLDKYTFFPKMAYCCGDKERIDTGNLNSEKYEKEIKLKKNSDNKYKRVKESNKTDKADISNISNNNNTAVSGENNNNSISNIKNRAVGKSRSKNKNNSNNEVNASLKKRSDKIVTRSVFKKSKILLYQYINKFSPYPYPYYIYYII